jgi:heme-degrading monooxygenase HmoA
VSTVYTYADWLIHEGREDEFVQIWTEFVDWSSGETDAALGGMLLQDSSDRRRFISIGPWRTAQAAYEWFQRPDLQTRSQALREVAERFEPRFLELKVRRGDLG